MVISVNVTGNLYKFAHAVAKCLHVAFQEHFFYDKYLSENNLYQLPFVKSQETPTDMIPQLASSTIEKENKLIVYKRDKRSQHANTNTEKLCASKQ